MHSIDIVNSEIEAAEKAFGCPVEALYGLGLYRLKRQDTGDTISIVTLDGVNRFGVADDYSDYDEVQLKNKQESGDDDITGDL